MSQFFITGAQRSGTTLLAVMLSNHPDILMERRVLAFEIITSVRSIFEILPFNMDVDTVEFQKWLMQNDSSSRLRELLDEELLKESSSIADWIEKSINKKLAVDCKQIWGDKSPNLEHYYNDVKLIFPKAKVIHMIRDGRAVAHSMFRRASSHILLSAQRWVDSAVRAMVNQQIVGSEKYLIIKYEDLVINPDPTMRKICNFLDIQFNNKILTATDDDVEAGQNYVKREVDSSIIDNWKERLTTKQIKAVENIQAPTLTRFGYPLQTPSDKIKYRPLSVFRHISYRQMDHFKSLFIRKRIGMVDRKNVEITIPFKNRLYSFFRVLIQNLFSEKIFKSLFPRVFYKKKFFGK